MITITIQTESAEHARREMQDLLGTTTQNSAIWHKIDNADFAIGDVSDVTAGEVTDKLKEALAEADGEQTDANVVFPDRAEPPKRGRGRPKKGEQVTIDADPQQIDIEEAIAETHKPDAETLAALRESEAGALKSAASVAELIEELNEPAIEPSDPTAGWTTEDARNAGRALLALAPNTDVGNRKLAELLQPFGVLRVKELPVEKIEEFVVAANKAVF